MKKRFSTGTLLALMLLASALTYLLVLVSLNNEYNGRLLEAQDTVDQAESYVEARNIIQEKFVGPWDADALLDGAIDGMVNSLGDRWSHYLTAEQYKEYQNEGKDFVGIGVTVSPQKDSERPQISTVYKDSPAMEAGIAPFDVVISVDGASVDELGFEAAVSRVRGEENTPVRLTLIRAADGKQYTVNVTRRTVKAEMIMSEIVDGDIGYLRVRAFSERVDEEFSSALNQLLSAGVTGLIVDVRFNPGGRLDMLEHMLDQFLPEVDLITLRHKDGTQLTARSSADQIELPMVVLINGDSYSAAEFFAVCLSEYERAKTVGEPTTGKGYAQAPIELTSGGAILLSIEEYFTPKGRSLAGVGYQPDYTVPMTPEQAVSFFDPAHNGDLQFSKAVEVLRGEMTAP